MCLLRHHTANAIMCGDRFRMKYMKDKKNKNNKLHSLL